MDYIQLGRWMKVNTNTHKTNCNFLFWLCPSAAAFHFTTTAAATTAILSCLRPEGVLRRGGGDSLSKLKVTIKAMTIMKSLMKMIMSWGTPQQATPDDDDEDNEASYESEWYRWLTSSNQPCTKSFRCEWSSSFRCRRALRHNRSIWGKSCASTCPAHAGRTSPWSCLWIWESKQTGVKINVHEQLTAATCTMLHRAVVVHVMEALMVAVHLAECAVSIVVTQWPVIVVVVGRRRVMRRRQIRVRMVMWIHCYRCQLDNFCVAFSWNFCSWCFLLASCFHVEVDHIN